MKKLHILKCRPPDGCETEHWIIYIPGSPPEFGGYKYSDALRIAESLIRENKKGNNQ